MGAPEGYGKEGSVEVKIDQVWDGVIEARRVMLTNQNILSQIEMSRKLEHPEEWASAKNNDVRRAMLEEWISINPVSDSGEDYYEVKTELIEASHAFKLGMLEVRRLQMRIDWIQASSPV